MSPSREPVALETSWAAVSRADARALRASRLPTRLAMLLILAPPAGLVARFGAPIALAWFGAAALLLLAASWRSARFALVPLALGGAAVLAGRALGVEGAVLPVAVGVASVLVAWGLRGAEHRAQAKAAAHRVRIGVTPEALHWTDGAGAFERSLVGLGGWMETTAAFVLQEPGGERSYVVPREALAPPLEAAIRRHLDAALGPSRPIPLGPGATASLVRVAMFGFWIAAVLLVVSPR